MKKPKKINSRAKGAAGERELAEFFRFHGFEARRGQQFHGGADSPDIVVPEIEGFHFEAKRVEAGNLYKWMEQASRDAGPYKVPVVAHRRNREQWLAIMPLGVLLQLLHRLETKNEAVRKTEV